MISKLSMKRLARWSNGIPKARNSASFQPDPTPSTKRPPLISSIARGHARHEARRVEGEAGHERADDDPLGRGRQRCRSPSTRPTARARALPRRGRADGRRARSSRNRPPRRRAPWRAAPPSAPRARPRAAGLRCAGGGAPGHSTQAACRRGIGHLVKAQETPPVRNAPAACCVRALGLPVGAGGLDAVVGLEQVGGIEALADLTQAVVRRAEVEALAVRVALREVEVVLARCATARWPRSRRRGGSRSPRPSRA